MTTVVALKGVKLCFAPKYFEIKSRKQVKKNLAWGDIKTGFNQQKYNISQLKAEDI